MTALSTLAVFSTDAEMLSSRRSQDPFVNCTEGGNVGPGFRRNDNVRFSSHRLIVKFT
jgi:hypothetical protein